MAHESSADNSCSTNSKPRLVAATRIHTGHAGQDVDTSTIAAFVESAALYADAILIAVGEPDGSSALYDAVCRASNANTAVQVIPVRPWGAFTPALNALLSAAVALSAHLVLFQSLETAATARSVQCLRDHLDSETDLVVGAALPGHKFEPGAQTLEGTTTPWNTLALWHAQKLARLGFLAVSEGLVEGAPAGVEEVATIALSQQLHPDCAAKLVRTPDVDWQAIWTDEKRRQWHESKMASKQDRAQKQIAVLRIPPGSVLHIDTYAASSEDGAG